ncbi:MAG TPA: tol-pal system protein YbgF, partial [Phenylobacterium sp.]|uniref:tol-pal system protein YbgF n=1 Tax=Phenylobacterium sp. TaxID=1871053 RepID=UPI002BCD36B5
MGKRRVALVAALGLALCAGAVAAQTPVDESLSKRDARRLDNMEKVVGELRSIVFRARDSKQPIVVEPADTDARLSELSSRLGDLEQTLTRVNGSLETTAHQLDEAKRENAALRGDVKALSDKLSALEQKVDAAQAATAAGGPAAGPAAEAGPPPPPAASPTEAFAQARQLMLAGSYDAAEAAFRDYVAAYPDAPKTPEARYWWGKTLQVRGAHAEAATAFIGAIRGWPKTVWAPDALVELARELNALKKTTDACQTLAELPRKYPKASAPVKGRAA